AGQASKTIAIPIVQDLLAEPSETVLLSLHNPAAGATLGSQATAVLTIVDDDVAGVLKWSASKYSVSEGTGQVALAVTRSGGSAGGVSVDYVIAGGSATAPPSVNADFFGPQPNGSLTGTLSFGPGVTTQTVVVPIIDDGAVESDEQFTVTLQSPRGGGT